MAECIKCVLNYGTVAGWGSDCRVYCTLCQKVYATGLPISTACAIVQAHTGVNLELHQQLHAAFMAATEGKPCRVIPINGDPYLERYYMGEVAEADGVLCQWWLHRFLRSDSERHLHTHSWEARSRVLTGWYLEELGGDSARELDASYRVRSPGTAVSITFNTLHRVAAVMPDTWTSLLVRPDRRETWDFVGGDGERVTMQSGGVDWWKDCGPRGQV